MNCSPRTLTTVLALGAFAVTGVAQAAPAKPSVSAGSGTLSGSSVALSVNNKSAYAVKGQVALSAGKVAAGKRAYSAKARKTVKVSVPLSAAAKSALAKKGSLRLTVKTSAKGAGKTVVRTSSVTVRKAAGKSPAAQPITQLGPSSTGVGRPAPQAGGSTPAQSNPGQNPGNTPGQNPGGNPGGGDPNPQPQPQPQPIDWRAGHIVGNSLEAFTFRTDAGQLTLTSTPSFNVKCSYTQSGQPIEVNATESFTQNGPFAIGGQDLATTKSATLNNSLMGGKPSSVTYTVSTTAENDERMTGQLKISSWRYESGGTPGKPGYYSRYISCGGSFPFMAAKA